MRRLQNPAYRPAAIFCSLLSCVLGNFVLVSFAVDDFVLVLSTFNLQLSTKYGLDKKDREFPDA